METLKDGTRINPSPICQVECAEKSSARVYDMTVDGRKWVDLCAKHTRQMVRVYKKKVEVRAAWNEMTMEEFEND